MSQANTVLLRLAEAFEASAKEFSAENARLATLGKTKAAKTLKPRHEVADQVWLDFRPDSNVQASAQPLKADNALRIQVADRGDSPWFSFSYALSVEALRSARFLGLLISGRAEGVAAFRPCLRYVLPDGFKDGFARNMILLESEAQDQITFIRIDPALRDEAIGAEVLFFFEGKSFDVTLNSVENLNI